jgi:hypothetical protein
VMVNNSINIIKTESLNSDGQQFHQYHQNRKFEQWWSTIPPISSKQKVWTVMVAIIKRGGLELKKKTVYPAPFCAGFKTGTGKCMT